MLGHLGALWTRSPQEISRKLSRLLRGRSLAWDYSIERILGDRKHMDHAKIIDRWHRYWRVIEGRSPLTMASFDFHGKIVLEVGCGPLFGFGPLAVFRGCSAYYYVEPNLDGDRIKASDILWSRYFEPMLEEMIANYGALMDPARFRDALCATVTPLDLSHSEALLDMVLSNSCLEHIGRDELGALLKALRNRCYNETKVFHAVDFGPHTPSNRLMDLYAHDDGGGLKHINGLRAREIGALLADAGFDCRQIPYKRQPVDVTRVSAGWARRGGADLEVQIAFFVGAASTGAPAAPAHEGARS